MKKVLPTLFFALMTATNWAQVMVDGIYYDLNVYDNLLVEDNVAEVVSGYYTGDVVIPETIYFDGVTYTVASIRFNAFRDCQGLTSVTIPNSVTCIGDCAFQDCTNLTSVTLSNSLQTIRFRLFLGCTSLASIEIPNTVTNIGGDAFSGCSSLESVEIPNSVTRIEDYAFAFCSSLTSIDVPNSVTTLGNYTFHSCTSLTTMVIPNSVQRIGDDLFKNCSSLTSIHIPNSVTTICFGAFEDCKSLTDVTVEWDEPIYVPSYMVFTNCPIESATLHVPSGTTDKYREAEMWREFGNIEEYDPTGIHQLENEKQEVFNGKYFHDGRIVIKKSGKEYTLDGKLVY